MLGSYHVLNDTPLLVELGAVEEGGGAVVLTSG